MDTMYGGLIGGTTMDRWQREDDRALELFRQYLDCRRRRDRPGSLRAAHDLWLSFEVSVVGRDVAPGESPVDPTGTAPPVRLYRKRR